MLPPKGMEGVECISGEVYRCRSKYGEAGKYEGLSHL